MACQEQAVFRPSYSPVYSLLWEASFVHNTQFTIHLCPVADRTGPFLRKVKEQERTEQQIRRYDRSYGVR